MSDNSKFYNEASTLLDRAVNMYMYTPGLADILEADNLRLNVTYSDLQPSPEAYIPGIPTVSFGGTYISIFFLYTGVTNMFMILIVSYIDDNDIHEIYRHSVGRDQLVDLLAKILENGVCIMTC